MIFALVIACSTATHTEPVESHAPTEVSEAAPKTRPAELGASAEAYEKEARALRAAIDHDEPAAIAAKADALTKTGAALLPMLQAEHEECAPYFAALEKVAGELHSFPIERIEKGFHEDGELPKAPGAACYHGKDLVVHPATVSALSKTWDEAAKKKAGHEIDEVLEHLKQATH